MWWAKVGRARIGVEGFETDLSQMRWRMRGARRGLRPNLPARRAFQRFEPWEGEGEGEGGQRREGEGERAPRGSQACHQACQASQASQAGLSRGIAWVPACKPGMLPGCRAAVLLSLLLPSACTVQQIRTATRCALCHASGRYAPFGPHRHYRSQGL